MKSIVTYLFLAFSTLSFSQSFDIYVSDAGNFNNPPWQILKFDQNGQNPIPFINSNLNWPQDILFIEDSNVVLISNLGSGLITKHNAQTGAYISNFASGLSGPTRTKIGPDGLLYVLQWNGNGKVVRYQMDGTLIGEFTNIGIPQSIGLDWDHHGNLYVSSYNGDLVRKFDTAGIDQGIFINSNLAGPTNIWFDVNGDLFVSDYDGNAIKRFDSTGTYVSDFIQGLSNSEGVAYLPNGNILIGNGGTNSVKLYDSSGTYINDLIPNSSGNLINPNAVVIRTFSNVSLTEQQKMEIHLLFPSIGTEFNIREEYIQTIKHFEVRNSSGSLIEKFQDTPWNASSYTEGTYIVTAYFKDGTTSSQKIIIKK